MVIGEILAILNTATKCSEEEKDAIQDYREWGNQLNMHDEGEGGTRMSLELPLWEFQKQELYMQD